ncbi:MAG: hypothetical protein KF757_12730 [Phycisphaeraceae bacterium]|nr:hypothetical protein [Phycisphaeraceae bacterium]MCW5762580.1 hypothetical protein [Phycisphaeraceae bacterium]
MHATTRTLWVISLFYLVLIGACVWSLLLGMRDGDSTRITLSTIGLIVFLGSAPIAVVLGARGSGGAAAETDVGELVRAIEQLAKEQVLSDDARRVLNRGRERELLRRAIEEDISAEDWDAAMVLVKELAERFGYRTDAENFRSRIETARYQTLERRVDEAIRGLDGMIVGRRWEDALSEAARISRLYPDSPRIEGLRHRVVQAQARYKQDLERRFLLASEQDRAEEALSLLKELDHYLTEPEAEPYREVAKGVIGKARENLGVQFKLAVQDRQWARAADVGDRIIAEFPNSRMAQEIREMIDGIRERAAGTVGS